MLVEQHHKGEKSWIVHFNIYKLDVWLPMDPDPDPDIGRGCLKQISSLDNIALL